MKIISRENRAKRFTTTSSISATASEMAIWNGMSTSENLTTNQTPLTNDGSWKALV